MMEINGMDISLTRGDCSPFTLTLTGEDTIPDGTDALFSVKKTSDQNAALIEKRVPVADGRIEILLKREDTENLPYGDYEWDLRFPDLWGEGEPYTPIKPQKFTVARVVGNVG